MVEKTSGSSDKEITYLVRKMKIITNEGKEMVFSLVVVSGIKNGSILSEVKICGYQQETEHTEYVSMMTIKCLSESNYEIIDQVLI